MISVRVSEREFELLKTLSESEGARSLSDFARLALCGHLNGASTHAAGTSAGTTARSTGSRSDLEDLKASVQKVAEMLEQKSAGSGQRSQLAAVGRKTGGI